MNRGELTSRRHRNRMANGGEAHILLMRSLSHESTTAYRQHASGKRKMWCVMRPAPLPEAGRITYPIFRFSMACLLQVMASVSTRLSSSGPGHHHRDDKRGYDGLRGGALRRFRGSPPQGDELSIGGEPPEGGWGTKKKDFPSKVTTISSDILDFQLSSPWDHLRLAG